MPDLVRLATSANLAILRRLIAHLSEGNRNYLARQFLQDRFRPANAAVAAFCAGALDGWRNRQYDVDKSGETALLSQLRTFRPRHVFDVGANIGAWSAAACRELPEATVHAFEIIEQTARHLRNAVAPFSPRVVLNQFGLGDDTRQVMAFFSAENSTTASTLRDVIELAAADQGFGGITEIKGQVRRGDDYLAAARVGQVDLLKIDVEGAEMQVLSGFADAFASGRVTLVQFEYGRSNLTTRVFLADFYHFLTQRGFVLGKLYPEGVAFKPYEVDDEDFVGPNYVACLAERTDIIAALRCAPLRFDGAAI